MIDFKFQVYTTDWDGVKGIYEVHSITLWDERYEKVKVVFRNSSGDIESQVVSKENVRQYTGLKDKNGKGIYIGDIVKINGHPFDRSIGVDGNYEIGYNEVMEISCGGWYLHRMRHWAEVIGNIYESPKLVKN
ncbi:YopX family protein [Bacillus pacificus]|uniref:YopX family protein n=1 Tax=Bacillus pacificus TaxID=2026187 RepID=UPI003D200E27